MMIRLTFLILIFLPLSNGFAQDIIYRDLGNNGRGLGSSSYNSALLHLIFEHARPGYYNVKPYPKLIPHARGFQALENNGGIDIVIGYATKQRVEQHLAIPLPIRKGLNGLRVALVQKDNQDMFKDINSLKQMNSFSAGQFHAWSDIKILEKYGIPVEKGSSLNGLYHMLDKKRFDYLPLSILQVNQKSRTLINKAQLSLVIEPHILIAYPACFYFYVNKKNVKLAKVINDGFEKIIANGEYDKLFDKHYGKMIKKTLTVNRKVIQLKNPFLPSNTPLSRKELWLFDYN